MDLSTPDCEAPASRPLSLLLPLCSAALFLSAAILFAMEPLFTKMVLPLMGGTPAVWNTAVMFFQAVLLAGYLYAHLLSRMKGLRKQALVHVGVLLVGLLFLPVHVGLAWTPTASAHPVPWLIALLAVSIGVPFFAISATAPLLQSWFSRSDHPHASDPYFLYVSSNVGGIAALLAYPVVVEPMFGLTLQGQLWTIGYTLLVVLIALYALNLWTAQPETGIGRACRDRGQRRRVTLAGLSDSVTWATRARWVALAFVPSALLLAVTMHISTDVAAAPFLWIAPLFLYSLSFILVFARRPLLKHKWMLALQPWVYALAALHFTQREPLCFTLPLHLAALFMAAMVCHGELVRRRPAVEHLTEFYFWMSAGGLLGGVFCVLIAPVVFNWVFEYPLVLVLGCLLLPSWGKGWLRYGLDIILPAAFAGLCYLGQQYENHWDFGRIGPVKIAGHEFGSIETGPILLWLAIGVDPLRLPQAARCASRWLLVCSSSTPSISTRWTTSFSACGVSSASIPSRPMNPDRGTISITGPLSTAIRTWTRTTCARLGPTTTARDLWPRSLKPCEPCGSSSTSASWASAPGQRAATTSRTRP